MNLLLQLMFFIAFLSGMKELCLFLILLLVIRELIPVGDLFGLARGSNDDPCQGDEYYVI